MSLPPFQTFLDSHREDVYRFLLVAAGPGDADDCFQETVLAALRAYPRLRDSSNLRGWILTIAQRKAIDAHRARGRRPVAVDPVPDGEVPASEPTDATLWAAVRELPPGQRAAVLHRFVNDLAYADIAALLGCSEEAARQRVHAGLATLRKVWSQ